MSYQSTKLFLTLSRFDAYAFNRLEKFVLSPYHNRNTKLSQLLEILRKEIFHNKKHSKEEIYRLIYNADFNDQKFRLLFSDLLKLTIEFIGYEEYKSDDLLQYNNELKGISEYQFTHLYSSTTRQIKKKLEKNIHRDSNYFQQHYMMESTIFNMTTEFEKKSNAKSMVLNYLEINRNLDFFYLIEKLKWYCNYLTWTRIVSHLQKIEYIDVIIQIIESLGDDIPIALKIYYKIYKTTIDLDDKESYQDLKELIFNNYRIFSQKEAKELYDSLINYCVRQANKGKTEYIEELLEIYDLGIRNRVLLNRGFITPTSFRNIVGAALRIKKFDWTEDFIENNIALVEEKYRDNAHTFNIARLHFYRKNYKNVISTIREVEFNDNLYANVSKTMLLVSYYEMEDDDALFYFADSFKMYLKRHKRMSDRIKKEYLNLVKYTKKLAKARYKPSILGKLKQEIIETKELASKKWFLEKLSNVE